MNKVIIDKNNLGLLGKKSSDDATGVKKLHKCPSWMDNSVRALIDRELSVIKTDTGFKIGDTDFNDDQVGVFLLNIYLDANEKTLQAYKAGYISLAQYLCQSKAAGVVVQDANIISQYPKLEVLGFTKLVKSSNRSSLYILEKENNIVESDITAVSVLGFTELTPVVSGLKIVLKALLPVVDETTELPPAPETKQVVL